MKQLTIFLVTIIFTQVSFGQDCKMDNTKLAEVLIDISSISEKDSKISLESKAYTLHIKKNTTNILRIGNKIYVNCKEDKKCIEKEVFFGVTPDTKESKIVFEVNYDATDNEKMKCAKNSFSKLLNNSSSIYKDLLDPKKKSKSSSSSPLKPVKK